MFSSRLYAHPFKLRPARNDMSLQETDKAVIDVEAQEDGILAKIVVRGSPVVVFTLWMFTRPRHRPRTGRRTSPSVALSPFSQRKATTFLVLQSWPPVLPRKRPLPVRKRLPRLQRLQNPRRNHHRLARCRSPSSRKATEFSRLQ
jgi:hypothetical protein